MPCPVVPDLVRLAIVDAGNSSAATAAAGNSGTATAAAVPTGDPAPPPPSSTATSPGRFPLEKLEPDQRVRLEGRVRPQRRRPVRAARPGVRRWTACCRSAPATRYPFGLVESGCRRLPVSSSTSFAYIWRAGAVGRRRLRLEQRGGGACVWSAGAAGIF
jgi:hypothetical protein